MAKKSAGILLYRSGNNLTEVLLLHPGGPFWKNKDEGAWTIPKGEYREGEIPLEAARREFREETGFEITGTFRALNPLRQKGGKTVLAWAVAGDLPADEIRSNRFELEWPPGSGRRRSFPEIDRAEWFSMDEARQKIIPGQIPLLEQLQQWLAESGRAI